MSLADLVQPHVETALPDLPRPQARRALAAAILLDDETPEVAGVHAVGAAVLNAIQQLAAQRRLLIVIDDAQWVDAASAEGHRLGRPTPTGRARGRAAARAASASRCTSRTRRPSISSGRCRRRSSRGSRRPSWDRRTDLRHRPRAARGIVLQAAELERVARLSDGNPFHALELARAGPDALPRDLAQLVEARLGQLPRATLHALAVCGHLARPTMDTLAATIAPDDPWTLLAPALDDGVVAVADGAVRFDHPLLAAGARAALRPSEARLVHQRLAATAPTSEERAAHRARCTAAPDEPTAAALEEAAETTFRRGATHVAAGLAREAVRFTPVHGDVLARRALLACEALSERATNTPALRSRRRSRPRSPQARRCALLAPHAASLLPHDEYAISAAQRRRRGRGRPDRDDVDVGGARGRRDPLRGLGARCQPRPTCDRRGARRAARTRPRWRGRDRRLPGPVPPGARCRRARRSLARARASVSNRCSPATWRPTRRWGMYLGFVDRLDEGWRGPHGAPAAGAGARGRAGPGRGRLHLAELEWRAGRWHEAAAPRRPRRPVRGPAVSARASHAMDADGSAGSLPPPSGDECVGAIAHRGGARARGRGRQPVLARDVPLGARLPRAVGRPPGGGAGGTSTA